MARTERGEFRADRPLIEERGQASGCRGASGDGRGRLRKRVRAPRPADLADYGPPFFNGGLASRQVVHLIDCVTTNKTDFFREPDAFRLPARHGDAGADRRRGGRGRNAQGLERGLLHRRGGLYDRHGAAPTSRRSGATSSSRSSAPTSAPSAAAGPQGRSTRPMIVEPVPPAMRQRYVMPPRDPERPRGADRPGTARGSCVSGGST